MFGIRVFDLPANATDKHLKVYFSNPRNGGGRVVNIYYPLPHGTAVIIFDDKKVVQEVLQREHTLLGKPIGISATPKQVFRRAVVELEKNVSDILSVNPQLVDELQFIGEININFQYEKERYLLDGSWYKIEWAMQYLDTALDAYQPDKQLDIEPSSPRSNSRERVSRRQFEKQDESPPRSHQIIRPNIPAVKQPREDEQPKSLPVRSGPPMSNFRKIDGKQTFQTNENDSIERKKKNKNVFPTGGASSKLAENKFYSKTMRSNLDDRNVKDDYESNNRGAAGNIFSVDDDWKARGHSYNKFDKGDDSDSENEANLAAAYDRRVGFSTDTNFDEYKARPKKVVPKMTMGIDVSHTDFGEVPLSFTFDLPGNLKVHVAMDDITKQTTDTIINPTTPDLSNVYGISRAIIASAGYEMQMECRRFVEQNGRLNFAGVTHTAAGGNLSQRIGFVIHTAGPSWREDESEYCTHVLVCTYLNCFQYADEKLWIQSLATPLISAGSFGFPLDVCIEAFYDALLIFSDQSNTKRHLKEIHLVCFDQDSAMATITIVQSLLDCERSQSVAAATDRYLMRKSKYNFEAEDFSKVVKEKSDDKESETNDADTSKPRDQSEAENRKSKKDHAQSDDFGDSDDERRKLGIASGKSDLDTSESKFTDEMHEDFGKLEQFKSSYSKQVNRKKIHDESDDSLEDRHEVKYDDINIEVREKTVEKESDNTKHDTVIENSDLGNKYEDVDSDNESNTEAETVKREVLMEEKEHNDYNNVDSEKDCKLRDTTVGTDDEIDEDDNDDVNKAFGGKEPDVSETAAKRKGSVEDLENSLTKSDIDSEAKKDVHNKTDDDEDGDDDDDEDDAEVAKENKET